MITSNHNNKKSRKYRLDLILFNVDMPMLNNFFIIIITITVIYHLNFKYKCGELFSYTFFIHNT